ncbi:hypothetical protein HRED_08066 [Candidatus Haloredivivus sp. G17]|nr:hypothetical protein HRED_08066 [Candidatus Haloredivivus sp. G17]
MPILSQRPFQPQVFPRPHRSEDQHVKNRDKVDESDFKALIDEVENQDDQIDEIREGYVELGEMMQLVLEELKN